LKPFMWPKKFKSAISLTFDDGLKSQLKRAVPMLDKYDFRATFYVVPRGNYVETLKPWREAAEQGHEIGNHTLTHPCSCNYSGDPRGRCLENMSLEDVRADIMEAHRRIREVIPEGSRTFAYPCYETNVGRGISKRSYVPVVAEIFLAARCLGRLGLSNSPVACDLHFLWSWHIDRMRFEEMNGLAMRATSEGRWAIYTFHGVDEGHLSVSAYDLERFLGFLYDHRDVMWVAPVSEVAEYIIREIHKQRLGERKAASSV